MQHILVDGRTCRRIGRVDPDGPPSVGIRAEPLELGGRRIVHPRVTADKHEHDAGRECRGVGQDVEERPRVPVDLVRSVDHDNQTLQRVRDDDFVEHIGELVADLAQTRADGLHLLRAVVADGAELMAQLDDERAVIAELAEKYAIHDDRCSAGAVGAPECLGEVGLADASGAGQRDVSGLKALYSVFERTKRGFRDSRTMIEVAEYAFGEPRVGA